MRALKISMLIAAALTMLAGCSSEAINTLREENNHLKQEIAEIEKQLDAPENKKSDIPSIMYTDYTQKLRLVLKETELHVYFGSKAPVINTIKPNTAIKVLDAGVVDGGEVWLYVEIPVYDIPAHYKGWIREADSVELTERNKKQAYDSVLIKKGTPIYNCEKAEEVAKSNEDKAAFDMNLRIEKIDKGYAYVFAAGGWNFWVKEESIAYAYDIMNKGE